MKNAEAMGLYVNLVKNDPDFRNAIWVLLLLLLKDRREGLFSTLENGPFI